MDVMEGYRPKSDVLISLARQFVVKQEETECRRNAPQSILAIMRVAAYNV